MRFSIVLLVCLGALTSRAQVDHSNWGELLGKHVGADGRVSYSGFAEDSAGLNHYLIELTSNPPSEAWSQEEKLAYWINAYNAFTVKLVVEHFPVSSIKDIKKGIPFVSSVWDINFIIIGDKKLSLNDIEHKILRKDFDEPRIHFAIVCASKSCPELRNEAYTADKLEQQLEGQAIDFINDDSKNHIEEEEIQISSIFKWFEKDFTKTITLREFIQKYSKRDFGSYAKVKFKEYDWSLNGY